jgi:hypothetical protein
MDPNPRVHNKSKVATLSITEHPPAKVAEWYWKVKSTLEPVPGLGVSQCCKIPAKDGRFTEDQKKVAYAYQIIAYANFGQTAMGQIAANKTQGDLTISHLCGTRNCCNPIHLVLESKAVNDDRTHCHACMQSAALHNPVSWRDLWNQCGCCPHNPPCGSR